MKQCGPPSFALAKAFTDPLERKGCVNKSRMWSIRSQIESAEKSTGAARTGALTKLTSELDGDRSCDPNKVDLLKKALRDLQSSVM